MQELIQRLTEAIEAMSFLAPKRAYPKYEDNDVLDNEEASAVLHCTVYALNHYVNKKGLPYHKAGVERLFFYGELIAWLKENECTTPSLEDMKKASEEKRRSSSIDKILRRNKKKD